MGAVVALLAIGCSNDPPRIVGLPTTTVDQPATDGAGGDSGPGTSVAPPDVSTPVQPLSSAAPHIWVINLENEGYGATFGPTTEIPYLAKDLTAKGLWLTQYFATSHNSLGNYIAQVSGQPPTDDHNGDCPVFSELKVTSTDASGVVEGTGCVFPAKVLTIGDQLEAKDFSWRQYGEDMANGQRVGEPTTCRHPQLGAPDDTMTAQLGDQYATRHIGFAYFRSVIDDSDCSSKIVDLRALPGDLATVDATPNLSFITPNLCNDGHDQPCVDGAPGGMVSANQFLQEWVPKIMAAPAFQKNGLLIVTFDEAEGGDTTGCCGDADGGGRVGAVVLGPSIEAGSTDDTQYNHYSLLCSLENAFGVAKLALAAAPGLPCFIPPPSGGGASKA